MIATTHPGAPWKLLNTGDNRFSPDAAKCPTSARCYGVYSTSPFDSGNAVWLSTDGGVSWHDRPSGSNRIRNDIACPTATTCYTVGNHGTITQTTNGITFLADGSPTTRTPNGIKCVSASMCYAVGGRGTILVH